MTLTQFKYVLEIAKAGSVNQAANNLFVSQSVLSNSIKALENELGQKIFFRSTQGMQPTLFGENFIANITPIQMHMDQLNMLLNRVSDSPRVSLSIATTGFSQLNRVLASIIHNNTVYEARIETFETSFDEAIAMVANELVNLAFIRRWDCYYNSTNKRLRSLKVDYFPINSFPMGITIGAGNPLYYSDQNTITPEMLGDYPCIMYNYLESGPYRDIYDRLKLPVHTRIITNSRASMYELINDTPAYYFDAMIPSFISEQEKGAVHNNTYVPHRRTLLLEGCSIRTEYGWLMRKGRTRTDIEEECIDLVAQWLRT